MEGLGVAQLTLQGGMQAIGQDSIPIFVSFAISNDDLTAVKVNIFHSQANALHQTEAAAVEELSHQLIRVRQVGNDPVCLVFVHDNRQAGLLFGSRGINGPV